MSAVKVVTAFLFFVVTGVAAQAKDETHTPHRLMSGRTLEIVTNDDTGYIGWVLQDRSRQQVGYGDFKDIAFDDPKIVFENPLGWDVKLDIIALKFTNGKQVVLFIDKNKLKRGPEITPGSPGTVDVRKDFDFKLLKREKKIRLMTYDDPKKPEVEKTFRWNGSDFAE